MDTSKEEIVNLRKQINRLKISLMFTQVLMIALLLILGYQCLWSIWNYHYLLQQISIPDIYQSGAVWIMNKATRTAIRKLKDSDGNYLLNRDVSARWGYTLLGKDVYCSDAMPKMAAKATAVYYGDFSGLAVKVAEDANIEVLREKYATQHAVGVVAWMEIDTKVEDSQKIAKLTMASA